VFTSRSDQIWDGLDMARILLGTVSFMLCSTLLPGLPSAIAQQGLVRSQSEAVEGAVQNQIREGSQPYLVQHRWADRRQSGRAVGRQQSWYLPLPSRTAVK
jgi:hypothetical protein